MIKQSKEMDIRMLIVVVSSFEVKKGLFARFGSMTNMTTVSKDVIRVGMFKDPPYSNGMKNASTDFAGIAAELVYLFCQTPNIMCQFDVSPDENFGIFENGTWNGMVKHIKDGLFDLSFPYFTASRQRFEVIDFSAPIFFEPVVLVTRKPEISNYQIDLFSSLVFHWSVWVVLIIFSILIGFLIACAETKKINATFCFKFFTSCIDVFSFVSDQSGIVTVSRSAVRFVIGFWSLSVVILIGTYCGKLTSSLISNTVTKLPFNNFESFVNCIEMKKCRFLIPKDFLIYADDLPERQSDVYLQLKKAIQDNPIVKTNDYDETLKMILNDKQRYSVALMGKIAFLTHCNYNIKCSFFYINYDTDIDSFPMKKNASFKESLNKFVAYANQAGLFHKFYTKLLGNEVNCGTNEFDRKLIQINIFQFLACLFIFCVGILISITAFFAEIFQGFIVQTEF